MSFVVVIGGGRHAAVTEEAQTSRELRGRDLMPTRILTWNMQGGDKMHLLTAYVRSNDIDVACLQECGVLPDGFVGNTAARNVNGVSLKEGTVKIGKEIWSVINFCASQLDADNKRCSLAIMTRLAVLDHWAVSASSRLRPLIGIKLPGDLWVYTIHAPSNASAAGVSDSLLDDVPLSHKYICLGDWNCAKATLRGNGSMYNAVSGGSSTHQSGGLIDYAVTKGVSARFVQSTATLASDHYSQVFEI
jgi:hypothetical protein